MDDGTELIHEEFADASAGSAPPRSHRAGMMAGLAVVGVALAVLLLVAPGGSPPKLPAQSVHDLGPVTTVPRATGTGSTAPAAVATSPSTTSPPPTTTTSVAPAGRTGVATPVGAPAAVTPAAPAALSTPTTRPPAATTTTAAPAPRPPASATTTTTTTTTTPPPTTTTTSCFLGLFCQ